MVLKTETNKEVLHYNELRCVVLRGNTGLNLVMNEQDDAFHKASSQDTHTPTKDDTTNHHHHDGRSRRSQPAHDGRVKSYGFVDVDWYHTIPTSNNPKAVDHKRE